MKSGYCGKDSMRNKAQKEFGMRKKSGKGQKIKKFDMGGPVGTPNPFGANQNPTSTGIWTPPPNPNAMKPGESLGNYLGRMGGGLNQNQMGAYKKGGKVKKPMGNSLNQKRTDAKMAADKGSSHGNKEKEKKLKFLGDIDKKEKGKEKNHKPKRFGNVLQALFGGKKKEHNKPKKMALGGVGSIFENPPKPTFGFKKGGDVKAKKMAMGGVGKIRHHQSTATGKVKHKTKGKVDVI